MYLRNLAPGVLIKCLERDLIPLGGTLQSKNICSALNM